MNCERAIDHVIDGLPDLKKHRNLPFDPTSGLPDAPIPVPSHGRPPRMPKKYFLGTETAQDKGENKTPKKCFSCLTVVDSDCRKCPNCGKGTFLLKSEKVDVVKSDILPIRGEDGWQSDDAHQGPEKLLQKVCHNRLTYLGVKYIVHLRAGAKTCDGMPDLVFVWAGQPFAIELKQRSGRIDEAQRDALNRMRYDGWNVAVCYSLKQMDDFMVKTVDDMYS